MSGPGAASGEDQKRAPSHPTASPTTQTPSMGIPAFTTALSRPRVTQAQHELASERRSRSRSSSESGAMMEVAAGRLAKRPRIEGDLESRWEEERSEQEGHWLPPLEREAELEGEIRRTSGPTEGQQPLTTRSALRGYSATSPAPLEQQYRSFPGGQPSQTGSPLIPQRDERRPRTAGSSYEHGSRSQSYDRERREYPAAYQPGYSDDPRRPIESRPLAEATYATILDTAASTRGRPLPPPSAGGWSSEHPASVDPRIHRRGTIIASSELGAPPLRIPPQPAFFGEHRESVHTTSALSRRLSSSRPQPTIPVAGSSSAIQASQYGSPSLSTDVDEKFGEGSGTTSGGGKTQAVFVNKLYTMLEDPSIAQAGLLRWSDDGMGFVCPNPAEFARTILPQFFKHNNWHSFVRQLNMYGFNKVNDVFQSLNAPPDAPVPWEFRHTIFRRGDPDAISRIKRRSVKSNIAAREQQAHAAAVAAHAASLSRYAQAPTIERRLEHGHYPRHSGNIPPPQARTAPYPQAPTYMRRPMSPPIAVAEWRDDSGRTPSDVVLYPPPQGEGRLVHQPVPPQMRPPAQVSARQSTVSPLQRQGSFEYGPFPTARRYSPTPEGQSGHERSVSQPGRRTSSGHLGIRAHDMVRDSEELCDKLTDVFSRVEGNRLNTTTLIDRVITRFGDRLNATELEETRTECTRLEQAGIHAVQAVSTCLSDSNHLSQSLRVLIDDLAVRGVVSREHSPASESAPSPEAAQSQGEGARPGTPRKEARPPIVARRESHVETAKEKEKEEQQRRKSAGDEQATERGSGSALRDILN